MWFIGLSTSPFLGGIQLKAELKQLSGLSIPEAKSRLVEFFMEWWGRSDIEICSSENRLLLKNKLHECRFDWNEQNVFVEYNLNRVMHGQEWDKFLTAMNEFVSKPVAPFYLEAKGQHIFIRKNRRRRDSKVLLTIFPRNETFDSDETLSIYLCDFEVLYPGIKPIYPRNKDDVEFDYTGWNEFSEAEWMKIFSNWQEIKLQNPVFAEMIDYVIEWSSDKLATNETLVIEGNL